jgi:hypothetical protein
LKLIIPLGYVAPWGKDGAIAQVSSWVVVVQRKNRDPDSLNLACLRDRRLSVLGQMTNTSTIAPTAEKIAEFPV